jgi:hypothetical protein
MKEIFEKISWIEPLRKEDIKGSITPGKQDIIKTLIDLGERGIFPSLYLSYLNEITEHKKKSDLSKKFLDILLFVKSNITTDKIHDWFINGYIPRTYFFGINSMNSLSTAVEKFNSINLKIDKNFDKINDFEKRLLEKDNRTISANLQKRKDDNYLYENELKKVQDDIENIIYQVESKLATGKKL